ncbi:MAG: type II toxin-antitoxin system Phd/YefM family antitoxin [Desulfobacteraceae bacterium]|nr:MAG: type II toxin-antitoxin system Phd/YefM family antitoxin [Desulfobacteraceae bacterium]
MSTINLDSAQTQLPNLIKEAISGKEVIITKDGKPLVKLVPVATPKSKPLFGSAKGLISMSEDFDAPLDDFQEYSS